MKKEDCIFCMLANGKISTNAIYEDEMFKIILDNAPVTRGHALILPKEHYADFFELPEETACKAIRLAKKMVPIMKDRLSADGFNIVQNNGVCAGQTVQHYHLHLVPRYENDGQSLTMKPCGMTDEEILEVCNLLAVH